jgi:hypothetical protein
MARRRPNDCRGGDVLLLVLELQVDMVIGHGISSVSHRAGMTAINKSLITQRLS